MGIWFILTLGWTMVIREAEVARLRGRPTREGNGLAGGDEVERLERAAHLAVTRADSSCKTQGRVPWFACGSSLNDENNSRLLPKRNTKSSVYARQANGELRQES
jgi:hypothetical protein